MVKKLSEMTLEELWQLFPIFLTEYQPEWADWYREQEALLRAKLPAGEVVRISHIGSTAVKTIWAKPIVDILVEVNPECEMASLEPALVDCGYRCMSRGEGGMSFNKGYTERGFADKVFHLHLRRAGDHRELYFRDYLIEHPEIAREYEQMKLALWKQFEHDRDGYTNAKTAFVEKYTEMAIAKYETE